LKELEDPNDIASIEMCKILIEEEEIKKLKKKRKK